MKLTDEQFEKLQPYEREIVNAYKNSYVHVAGSDFQKIHDIYKEVFGAPLTRSQMACNTCRLNALRKLGELFVQHTQDKPKSPKSPRGRKPKLGDGREE